jgi:hypothetical protein
MKQNYLINEMVVTSLKCDIRATILGSFQKTIDSSVNY